MESEQSLIESKFVNFKGKYFSNSPKIKEIIVQHLREESSMKKSTPRQSPQRKCLAMTSDEITFLICFCQECLRYFHTFSGYN